MSLPKDNKDSIPEPVKGLEGIVAADTNLSSVNGEKGILRYCGYNIDDLAFNTTFEETICLLYDNELPNQERLEEMTKKVGEARVLPDEVIKIITELVGKTSPMSTLRTVVSVLGHYEKNVPLKELPPKALRLVGQISTAVAIIHRLRKKLPIIEADPSKGHAEDFLRMLHGKEPTKIQIDALNLYLILLADHLDLKGVAFGLVIENGWLKKGAEYRNFAETKHWKYWSKRFNEAGLHLVLPVNMISEAGCMKICHSNQIGQHLNSCMRGNGETGCGKCWKCFHKNGPIGREIDCSSHEISTFLQKRPLRTGMHSLWAIKGMNIEHLVPDLKPLLQQDFSWWENYYRPGLELLPNDLREIIEDNLKLNLEIMRDHSKLTNVNLFPE